MWELGGVNADADHVAVIGVWTALGRTSTHFRNASSHGVVLVVVGLLVDGTVTVVAGC